MLASNPNKYLTDLLCEIASAPETVPRNFRGQKNWCSFMGSRASPSPRRKRKRKRKKKKKKTRRRKATPPIPWKRPGGRALLISFISRSTSYAVLSRMKTKACKRNFSSFFLRFITTLPFSLTTPLLNYIHGAN